jgi:hypothetical protein
MHEDLTDQTFGDDSIASALLFHLVDQFSGEPKDICVANLASKMEVMRLRIRK